MHPLTRPGVTEANLKTFIGNNADKIIRRGLRDISWCWPALFVPSLWLAYRKAYGAAFAVFVVECIASAWGIYILIGTPEFGFNHPWLLATLLRVVVALFGLHYYLNLASKRVAKIEADTTDIASRQMAYKRKGGTSIAGMLLFLIFSSAVGTVIYGKGVQSMSTTGKTMAQNIINTQSSAGTTVQTTTTVQSDNTTVQSTVVQTTS